MSNSQHKVFKIKRRRGACKSCKERKIRCNGERPCSTCHVSLSKDLYKWCHWHRNLLSEGTWIVSIPSLVTGNPVRCTYLGVYVGLLTHKQIKNFTHWPQLSSTRPLSRSHSQTHSLKLLRIEGIQRALTVGLQTVNFWWTTKHVVRHLKLYN